MALPFETIPYQRNSFLEYKVIFKSAQPAVLTPVLLTTTFTVV